MAVPPTDGSSAPPANKFITLDADPTPSVNRLSSGLRALCKIEIQPQWRGGAPSVSASFLRIQKIEVVRSPTHPTKDAMYAISIYHNKPMSRIPTLSSRFAHVPATTTHRGPHSAPTIRINRSLRQFAAFRDSVHTCVHSSFQGCACGFCSQLMVFLTFGRAQSMGFATLAFDPERDASNLFEILLQQLQEQCQSILKAQEHAVCRGQRHIPYLLNMFLQESQD